jgi:polyribonucleotide nucleotidyltransferase
LKNTYDTYFTAIVPLIIYLVSFDRYLEENELMATFSERLQEEIEFEVDEMNKKRRQNRYSEIKRDIINAICEQYEEGTVLDDLTRDEVRYVFISCSDL